MRRTHSNALLPSGLLLLFFLLLAAPFARADSEPATWETTDEAWYVMELAGGRAGWMHLTEEKSGELYRTSARTHLEIGRVNTSITAMVTSSFVEKEDGTPVRLHYAQDMSAQTYETTMEFEADGIVFTTKQGDHSVEKRLPRIEEPWLTPRQITQAFKDALETGKTSLSYSTLDGSFGTELIDIEQEKIGEETIEVDSKPETVTVWKSKISMLPAPATERYDANGELVSQVIDFGFGAMGARRCSREEAMQPADGAAPELLVATFVTPDHPIKRIDNVERLELRLSLKEGEMIDLPSAGAQRFTLIEDRGAAIVTIDLNREGDDWSEEKPENLEQYLESSVLINAKDEKVAELAERAVRRAGDDSMPKAEAMRKFVHRHINRKGLEVAFASAAETARDRRGDCSEHAMLLCAMLRAEGIPARIASGLLYVDVFAGKRDSFGWHMWTQAWIGDRWVDLDATLPTRYHAGHILTGASSLADGVADSDFTTLLTLMGRLKIEVVSVEYAGESEPSIAR